MNRPCFNLLGRLAAARGLAMRPPPVSGWLTASDGTQLHYLDWAGGAETLVLLHGGGLCAHTFDLLALALPQGLRCIALDFRGHGLSGWAEDYAIERSAADVVELVEQLGAPRVDLAGMSLGGCVAGHAAARLGPRLASLAFIDMGPVVNFAATTRMRSFMAIPRREGSVEAVVEAALAVSPRTDPDLMLYRYQGLLRLAVGGVALRADRRRPPDFPHILDRLGVLAEMARRIMCSTLVIRGGRSRVISDSDAREFAARFPAGTWSVAPDAGHNVQEDQPAALASLLRSHIFPRRPDDELDPAVRRPAAGVRDGL